MGFEDVYETVVKELDYSWGIATARITPESRLTEDLGLSMDAIVDDLIADLGGYDLNWATVYRGFDRHYLTPVRIKNECERERFLGLPPRSAPTPESSLVPLTVADVVRILGAKRYVCDLPPGVIEDTVLRNVAKYASAPHAIVTDDTRLREDLGFEWDSFRKVLVSIDLELEGAFYSGERGGLLRDAYVYWHGLESGAAIPPITVRDLIATVRENCWAGPIVFAWRSEDRALTHDEILCVISWVLLDMGVKQFQRIEPQMRLDEDLKLFAGHGGKETSSVLVSSRKIGSVLIKLDEVIGGRFTNSLELRDKFTRYLKTWCYRRWLPAKWRRSMTVADLANIVQANQWVEPKGCTR